MQYDVFISYSRKDTKIADKICSAFANAGITFFIDRKAIHGGNEFPKVIAEAIMESRIFLFLASENAYSSKFTSNEITFAFNKKPKETIVPYIIDKSDLPIDLDFVFSSINRRYMDEHPIEPALVNDILLLLKREVVTVNGKQLEVSSLKQIGRKTLKYLFAAISALGLVSTFFIGKKQVTAELANCFENIAMLLAFLGFILCIIGYTKPQVLFCKNRKEISLLFLLPMFMLTYVFSYFDDLTIALTPDKQIVSSDEDNNENFNEIEAIDLGLPSKTLWADKNIGAKTISDYGDLFSWGELKKKENYGQSFYSVKTNFDITGKSNDVATFALGQDWQMPTESQYDELLKECTWTWEIVNGINGYKVVGHNGASIFLPASGWSCSSVVEYRNKYGYYWTSTYVNDNYAKGLLFSAGDHKVGNGYRYYGRCARAVKCKQ